MMSKNRKTRFSLENFEKKFESKAEDEKNLIKS